MKDVPRSVLHKRDQRRRSSVAMRVCHQRHDACVKSIPGGARGTRALYPRGHAPSYLAIFCGWRATNDSLRLSQCVPRTCHPQGLLNLTRSTLSCFQTQAVFHSRGLAVQHVVMLFHLLPLKIALMLLMDVAACSQQVVSDHAPHGAIDAF